MNSINDVNDDASNDVGNDPRHDVGHVIVTLSYVLTFFHVK